jgi:hypothetical protein
MLYIGTQVFGKALTKHKDTAVNKTQEILMLIPNVQVQTTSLQRAEI